LLELLVPVGDRNLLNPALSDELKKDIDKALAGKE
jgi:hypothetical protein